MDINDFGHNSFVHTKGLKERIEMTEHLFKLKKDGKTVGYSRINDYGQLMFRFPNVETWLCKDKFWEIMIKKYGFGLPPCSYYPFITKDKNSKNVFAGDPVRYADRDYPKGFEWDESGLRWDLNDGYFHTHYGATGTGGEDDYFDIELIEDKDNE